MSTNTEGHRSNASAVLGAPAHELVLGIPSCLQKQRHQHAYNTRLMQLPTQLLPAARGAARASFDGMSKTTKGPLAAHDGAGAAGSSSLALAVALVAGAVGGAVESAGGAVGTTGGATDPVVAADEAPDGSEAIPPSADPTTAPLVWQLSDW